MKNSGHQLTLWQFVTPLANQTNGEAAANIKPAPIIGRCSTQATAAIIKAIDKESIIFVPTGKRGSGAKGDKYSTRDTVTKIAKILLQLLQT